MIKKLEPRHFGPDSGFGGATFSDVIDKVNEIIDAMNGEHDPADIYSEDGRLIAKKDESEDERMIRKIEMFLSAYGADYFSNDEWREIEDWLEKQKEQNKCPEFCSGHCVGCERNEQNPVETSDFKTKLAGYLQNNSPKDGQYVISSESILEMAKEELIKRGVVQKPAEWSEFDKGVLKDAICAADILGNDESFNKGNPNLGKAFRVAKDWLKSLPERFNLQPNQEWSEEDNEMRLEAIRVLESGCERYRKESGCLPGWHKVIDWLKSLRPQWKPTEDEEPEYYQHFDPDC